MTKNIFKHNKSKLILILFLVGILCLSLFSVACNNSNSDESDIPSYSYVETDDGDISNPTFAYGTLNAEISDFPKTSPTGWSRNKDSSDLINQSSAKSGVINVTEDGWKELMLSLYKDTYIRKYVERTKGITESDVKKLIIADESYNPTGDEKYKVTSDDLKKYYAENYYSEVFENPNSRPDAKDDVVYMLNNYLASSKLGIGSSQKITSASEIVLNKGEYGKISVWIKTQNLLATENDDYGANIRLTSEFNGTTQAEYAVKSIRADQWTEYSIYVKADEHYETTIKVALGLGYGLNGITQGTVFFDDVQFTHLTAEQFNSQVSGKNGQVNKFAYNSTDKIVINGSEMSTGTYFDENYLLYDMTFSTYIEDNANGFFSIYNGEVAGDFTSSNKGSNGKRFDDSNAVVSDLTSISDAPFSNASAKKIEINKASYTVKYKDFSIGCEEYVYLAFYVKNQLSALGSTNISVNIAESYTDKDNNTYNELNADVATVSTVDDEWQKIDLVIKNNFAKLDNDRTFDIEFVIGPADVSAAKYAHDFASGTVLITSPVISNGTTAKYDGDNEQEKTEADKFYDIYSLLSVAPSGSISLTAGFSSDYTDSSDVDTYALTTAPSDVGSIINYPASVKGYQGIVANHFYIKEEVDGESIERDIDTRKKGDQNGVAGLINTKYLNNYVNNISALSGLVDALNFTATKDEENIQALMIYNSTKNHYGYVGTTNNISSSSYAKVSVTLRVTDSANAYVYLVDVDNNSKDVLSFASPADNSSKDLMLKINQDNMSDTGWVTVDFYLATGATAKNFRVEVWNGGRDGADETASQGYVFVKDVTISTSWSELTEPTDKNNAFSVSGNPLYKEVKDNGESLISTILYTRELTDLEKKFNSEQTKSSDKISYKENYVWAESSTMIYAVYNTIDAVEVDPYAEQETEDTVSEGCTAETDHSTFWLSFSSILLAVALVLAILMLVIKNVRRRRKANASDAKSHYTITSRTKTQKPAKKAKLEVVEETEEVEETVEKSDSADNNEEKKEETLDSYVYGDVEVFGEEKKEENND